MIGIFTLATIKVKITTIPFPLTLPLAIGLPAARCISPIHTFPPSQQSSSTWPLVVSTKFRMPRFSLVSPSAKVTSFKSQHNNTSQSGWRSERVSEKLVKSMALDPLQSNMDWIGLDWLAGTCVSTTLRIVHRPKPFLKFPVYRLITLFWIGKVPLLLCQLVKRTYPYL